MTLNQRSMNLDSTLYACCVLSLHHVVLLSDGADSKCSILELGMAKFDLEFDRTSSTCIGVIGLGVGAGKLQCRASY